LSNPLWKFLAWFTGTPAEQLECNHPPHARDYRLNLLAEENAMDAYEMCLNCGKEWHPKTPKNKRKN